ncbi:MAG: hypothetical protein K2H41_08925 [Acetatifactor sp.]|nr:hypothetical protein [Acetatifactor sp.]
MESKALDSVLRTTEVMRNPADEISAGDRKKKTEEGYGNKEVELIRNYDAISKNGDTVELSEEGRQLGVHMDKGNSSLSGKKIFSDAGKKITDNILTGYSEAKLRQLYANKEITKQQYDRIIKKRKIR